MWFSRECVYGIDKAKGVNNKMNDELVTAIISTYKRPAEMLRRAVSSVVNQTHKNLEIIIVNDYPEDENLSEQIYDMLHSFKDDRISYLCMAQNSGACAARNYGIIHSTGMYIELLDDDDAWCPEKTKLQLKAFSNNKVGLVYSPYYNYTAVDEKPRVLVGGRLSGNVLEAMLYNNIAGGCSMTMLSRKALEQCGIFDEAMLSSQDYDLYLRIAMQYEFAYVGIPLIHRYLLAESITENEYKQAVGWKMFTEKYKKLYEDYPDAYSYRINERVNLLIEKGRFKEAAKRYKEAMKFKFFSKYNIIEPLKGFGKYMGYKNKKDCNI